MEKDDHVIEKSHHGSFERKINLIGNKNDSLMVLIYQPNLESDRNLHLRYEEDVPADDPTAHKRTTDVYWEPDGYLTIKLSKSSESGLMIFTEYSLMPPNRKTTSVKQPSVEMIEKVKNLANWYLNGTPIK